MITCVCPDCGGRWVVADELAGHDVGCAHCGGRTVAPIYLPCEDEGVPGDGATLTVAELEAIKKGL